MQQFYQQFKRYNKLTIQSTRVSTHQGALWVYVKNYNGNKEIYFLIGFVEAIARISMVILIMFSTVQIFGTQKVHPSYALAILIW